MEEGTILCECCLYSEEGEESKICPYCGDLMVYVDAETD